MTALERATVSVLLVEDDASMAKLVRHLLEMDGYRQIRHVYTGEQAILAARELVLLALVPALRRRGLIALPVHYLGKAATFALYWGFPFVLLGSGPAGWEQVVGAVGWAFVIWGTALYWYAALLYLDQARRVIRAPA
jgi:phosphatidylglycerophosphate synthase